MSHDQLFDEAGRRLYLTAEERAAFLAAARNSRRAVRTLCETLHYTGCRLSEALALTPRRIDFSAGTVTFETLKKRRRGYFGQCRYRLAIWIPWTWAMASGMRSGARLLKR